MTDDLEEAESVLQITLAEKVREYPPTDLCTLLEAATKWSELQLVVSGIPAGLLSGSRIGRAYVEIYNMDLVEILQRQLGHEK